MCCDFFMKMSWNHINKKRPNLNTAAVTHQCNAKILDVLCIKTRMGSLLRLFGVIMHPRPPGRHIGIDS